MKTIILCGGQGTRLREETEFKPKALVTIGNQPILLHIMHIYAKHGHKDFLLGLGYKGDMIREFFLHLDQYSNDLTLDLRSGATTILHRYTNLDYSVSFIDTGILSDTAERVLRAARYITDDEFMISYGDDVSDVNIKKLKKFHDAQTQRHKTLATITAAHPSSHFGQIWADKRDVIRRFVEKPMLQDYVNGGFMIFRKAALKYLRKGETLEQGLERLAQAKKLSQYKHEGFWHGMNTMKDVLYLNELWKKGPPWL